MKRIWLLIIAIVIISCKTEETIDYAIVSGKVTNSSSKELTLRSIDKSVRKTITLNADGTFIDTLRANINSYSISETRNRIPLFVNNGNHIILNFDAKDFKNSLNYFGTGFEASNYLFVKEARMAEMMGKQSEIYKLEESVFKSKMNEIKKEIEVLLASSKGIAKTFKAKEKRDIHYNYLNKLIKYRYYHSRYAKKRNFKVSPYFLQEMDDFDYNNEKDYLFSSNYKELVKFKNVNKTRALTKSKNLSYGMAFLEVSKTIQNEAIRNDCIFSDAKGSMKYVDNLDAYLKTFNAISTNNEHKKEVLKIYNKVKVVSIGHVSPKFYDYENHAGGTTSLDDLKGKYVYIDVWATWCGPCVGEVPFLKEIEKKYHGKNIHFLSISIDNAKDHDKWVKMVNDKELRGIQLIADHAWKSQFIKDYLIMGIPHFILLDPEGKIVKYSAPRPSSSELIDLFDTLGL